MKKALIFGIGGQDGSYLAEILLDREYEVHGMYRRSSVGNLSRIQHILPRVTLHKGDMGDPTSILRIIEESSPDEIYNEADQDNVDWSYTSVGYSCDITAGAVGRTLEIIRQVNKNIKFFQPVTATMFGSQPPPQNENTPFDPQSPYAVMKVAAYYLCRYYRQSHGMFVSTAIFFNHDSPRRTEDYLLHKICKSAVRIARGEQSMLHLGNMATQVDIGYAKDYMKVAWEIMQQPEPDDFVIGTGIGLTIAEMVEEAFYCAGADMRGHVGVDPKFFRPQTPPALIADPAKARKKGFWLEHSIKDLIEMLVKDAEQPALSLNGVKTNHPMNVGRSY